MKYLLLFSLVYRKWHLGINAKSHNPDHRVVEHSLGLGSLAVGLTPSPFLVALCTPEPMTMLLEGYALLCSGNDLVPLVTH